MSADVTVTVDDHVAVLEWHRPPHNYFDVELIAGIADALHELDADPACRAVVLCSEGRSFCAGADLGPGSDLMERTQELYAQAVRIFEATTPTVAAVQGHAVGGGLGVALAADFRVAAPSSNFSCNFAKLGFHQGFGITVTLPDVVGQQRAHELLYTGGRVKGAEALAIGLADRLSSEDDLRAAAVAFADELAAAAPLAVRSIRATMRAGLAARVAEATVREHAEQQRLRATDDFREGVAATAERRPPEFTGR